MNGFQVTSENNRYALLGERTSFSGGDHGKTLRFHAAGRKRDNPVEGLHQTGPQPAGADAGPGHLVLVSGSNRPRNRQAPFRERTVRLELVRRLPKARAEGPARQAHSWPPAEPQPPP